MKTLYSQNLSLHPSLGKRLTAGLSFGVLSLSGLALNVLLALTLHKNWHTFKSEAFYVIAKHLMLADILLLSSQLFIAAPLSFAARPLYGEGLVRKFLASFDTIAAFSMFNFTFVMTLNRFTIFVAPRMNEVLFTRPRIYGSWAFPWMFGLLIIGITEYFNCPKTFYHLQFHFGWNCTLGTTNTEILRNALLLTNVTTIITIIPVVSLVMYCIVLIKLKSKSRSIEASETESISRARKRERKFLLQALIICLSVEIEALTFNILPRLAIFGYFWEQELIGIIINLNSSVNPVVYFVFNTVLRNAFLQMIGLKKNVVTPAVIFIPVPLPPQLPRQRHQNMDLKFISFS